MKIYEFAILFVPNDDAKDNGAKPQIVVTPQVILANDEREATLKAAKMIPDEYDDRMDQLQVAVRPF